MSARASDPLARLYDGWVAAMQAQPDMTLEGVRALFEHWGDVTSEPRGLDYLEVEAGGVDAMWLVPKGAAMDRVLLCAHGGGYGLGSMYSHRKMFGHFAKAVGCRALVVDYRRPPEAPFPAPVDDMTAAYAWLLEGAGIAARHVAFLGDSAGGALAISTLLRAREKGLPLPAASIPLAPYLDLEAKGESYDSNAGFDRLGSREATLQFVNVVLGEDGDRHDPLASPLYADLRGLPPLLIQVGGHDVLLDDARQFHGLALAAGVDCTLEETPGMQHVFHFLAGVAPEADAAIARAAAWVRPKLGLGVNAGA